MQNNTNPSRSKSSQAVNYQNMQHKGNQGSSSSNRRNSHQNNMRNNVTKEIAKPAILTSTPRGSRGQMQAHTHGNTTEQRNNKDSRFQAFK